MKNQPTYSTRRPLPTAAQRDKYKYLREDVSPTALAAPAKYKRGDTVVLTEAGRERFMQKTGAASAGRARVAFDNSYEKDGQRHYQLQPTKGGAMCLIAESMIIQRV